MSRARAVIALVLLSSALVRAQDGTEDAAAEREEVQDKLELERAALSTLKDQQSSVLSVIDLIERRAHQTEVRAQTLERELKALRRRRELAEREEAVARMVMQEQLDKLSPRLRALYRLNRRNKLDALLSADDFASAMWRVRALSTLLDRDLSLVRETNRAIASQASARRNLERLQESLQLRAKLLGQERELSAQQQELLTQLLQRIAGDAAERSKLVRELEQAERRLSRMVDDFDSDVDDSAFAAMKGKLPWPAAGVIEVGFGKLVNPRFNTVTFQKGLDIRAREGQPVLAVAPGKVVYAAWLRGYGNILIIDHGSGYHTLAAHLSAFSRQVGEDVQSGDEVGQVGDTGSMKGAYLYFELRKNGIAIDPAEWLGAGGL